MPRLMVVLAGSLLLLSELASADAGKRREVADLIFEARQATPPKESKPGAGSDFGLEAVPQSLAVGLSWLTLHQNLDGSWGTSLFMTVTSAVIESMAASDPNVAAMESGSSWLAAQTAADHEFLARQTTGLAAAPGMQGTAEALGRQVIGVRNPATTNTSLPNYPEGGWGVAPGYETDCLTTALALTALDRTGFHGGFKVISRPVAGAATNVHSWNIPADALKARVMITVSGSTIRLRMTQGAPPSPAAPYFSLPPGGPYQIVFPDSGLPFTAGTNYISIQSPSPPGLLATYTMTASYETPVIDTRALDDALQYLRLSQQSDGGWGLQRGQPSEFYTTLHVVLALQDWADYEFATDVAEGLTYIGARQAGDGSFGYGGPPIAYVTALAALSLIRSDTCPYSTSTTNAVMAVQNMQALDGSWSSEAYDTGLGVQALWEYDNDGDGVFRDGDCSGTAGDNLCLSGQTVGCDDNCVAYFNPGQESVVFGQTISLPNRDNLSWPAPADVAFVKGDLLAVNMYNVIAFGTASYATLLDIAGDSPPPDGGFYYLLRLAGDCTVPSWQSILGEEPGRDIALRGVIDIVITSPTDGAILTATPVTVAGTVTGTAPINVTVNGVAATVTNGIFTASVPLTRGANTISASGSDAAGSMGSDQISVTLVDYSIARGGFVTGMRVFTGAAAVLDQAAFFTESQIGVPPGVTYTTTGVARISATEMRVSFRIDVAAGATPGLHLFQVDYGLLDSSSNPLGPLSGDIFDFAIEVRP